MIIDTFLFNDEFDMLDIHLAITNHFVDRWIVLEASRTFSGIPKPYNLTENLARYQAQYPDRIQVVTLELTAEQTNLICETMMRQGLQPAVDQYSADDIVIHGDLDEIVDPTKWSAIVDLMNTHDRPVTCGFEMYMYRFDQRADRGWKGSVVARKRMFVTPHELYKGQNVKRKDRSHCVGLKEPVGWHWTWIGTDELVKNKVRSCIESQHRDPEQILEAFKRLDTISAINHKCTTQTIDTAYPEQVQTVLKNYPEYWNRAPAL
jgi:beta-1,4-mannosyl-glycoprotein beta-1,4-N-acetylglucosaminyltransferase